MIGLFGEIASEWSSDHKTAKQEHKIEPLFLGKRIKKAKQWKLTVKSKSTCHDLLLCTTNCIPRLCRFLFIVIEVKVWFNFTGCLWKSQLKKAACCRSYKQSLLGSLASCSPFFITPYYAKMRNVTFAFVKALFNSACALISSFSAQGKPEALKQQPTVSYGSNASVIPLV